MTNNILVIGGTGKTGRKVVEVLKRQNQNVRIGSRNNNPVFDWGDPATYSQALRDMDMAYISYYPDLAVPGAKEAIQLLTEYAIKEGLKKVVLLSGKGEKEAEACEEIVANSGLNYTLIRASWFSQNFSESFLLEPIQAGLVALPMSHVKIPFVDTSDIAEAVVASLMEHKSNGKTYEITGPKAITFEEAIQEIATTTGRFIQFQPISLGQYSSRMKAAGVPTDFIWLFDYLFSEVLSNPKNQIVSTDVQKFLGREATDFRTYVEETAKSGIWNQEIIQAI